LATAKVWQAITYRLVMLDRKLAGREASPSAAVIDSQSVKINEAGGPRGYDSNNNMLGRKRHAMVDTDGRPLVLQVQPASCVIVTKPSPLLQASPAAFHLSSARCRRRLCCQAGVTRATCIAVEIVRKPAGQVAAALELTGSAGEQ
jgi:putative transposase